MDTQVVTAERVDKSSVHQCRRKRATLTVPPRDDLHFNRAAKPLIA
jgi:hypothetical protein